VASSGETPPVYSPFCTPSATGGGRSAAYVYIHPRSALHPAFSALEGDYVAPPRPASTRGVFDKLIN